MATQVTSAKRGVVTPEMMEVAKEEDMSVNVVKDRISNGSIIIPNNINRKQKDVKHVGIGNGLRTKVNVNIGTSTLYQDLDEEISKAKVAVKYGGDTIMDLSDGGNLDYIREKLLEVCPHNLWHRPCVSGVCIWGRKI